MLTLPVEYVCLSAYSKYWRLVIPLKASERATPPSEPIWLIPRLGIEIIDNYFTTTFQESTEIMNTVANYNMIVYELLHVPQTEYHSAGKASWYEGGI